jgi:manganese/zinc/iron transport system permease protein
MLELTLVLAAVAAACAIPGVFLVLRRTSLISDAIGHVLLLGIVLAYFLTRDLDSPWLLFGAALAGLITVLLVEALQSTRRVKSDAAIGLVFPALFALGVLLVSLKAGNIHLDVDAVLLGQPESADIARWQFFGVAVKPLVVVAAVLLGNLGLCLLLYKELKLTTFDPVHAVTLGYRPESVHYGLMAVVSVTAVAAFDAVGPVLVVGFFVVPAATAFLLTDRLGRMIVLACGIGVLGSVLGVVVAAAFDTNTAGSVAAVLGLFFGLAFLFAPLRGQLPLALARREQRRRFEEALLLVHLYQHEGRPEEADEARLDGLHAHLRWTAARVAPVVSRATQSGLVRRDGDLLKLTDTGRELARRLFGPLPSNSHRSAGDGRLGD